jgi:UDP-N-acetylglucosamine transferase subunit ALG13
MGGTAKVLSQGTGDRNGLVNSRFEHVSLVVSVGTDHHPFDRLMAWVDAWLDMQHGVYGTCVVQSGTSRPPRLARSSASMPHDELLRLMREARAVVTHGGPATICDARDAGKIPVVVPRRRDLGEHVDDHQVAFCKRASAEGWIKLASGREAFLAQLSRAVCDGPGQPAAPLVAPGVEGFAAEVDRLLACRARRLLLGVKVGSAGGAPRVPAG